LPYRRPVLRTDYKYPPPNHPFRLIAQRILDGEIVDWDLPVDTDFEYQVQLSGPIIMQGAFKPELIQVQELALDGYAYWLHVEVNQEIRASAIMLPPKYDESSMTFTAEGVAAVPHYQYYDSTFSQIGVDAFSVIRTLWNYVQAQPQSDYGVTVTQDNSGQTLGLAEWDELIFDPATQEFHTDHHDAEPYEIMWWDAVNIGEEIDKLSGQIPFDFLEHHKWNSNKTDVDHSISLGYPRLGQTRPNLMFDEENIIEVVPVQEGENNYASAVLVIGGGEGEDSIRSYVSHSYGDRVRKVVVITDKTINKRERADALAQSELTARTGGRFEIAEVVIDAYHPHAPIGTYDVGDDIQVRVQIPWLMETQVAWYRITSITFKPSSDKIRLGLSLSSTFVNTSEIIPDPHDNYVPPTPIPPGPLTYAQYVTLTITTSLTVGSTLIPALIGGVFLTSTTTLLPGGIVLRTGSVSMTVGKTLTAAGIATAATASTVTLISNKTLTVGGTFIQFAAVSMTASSTFPAAGVTSKIGATTLTAIATISASIGTVGGSVSLTINKTLSANGTSTTTFGFGSTLFGAMPFGSNIPLSYVTLNASMSLTANAVQTRFGAVALSAGKTLAVGGFQTLVAAVGMTVTKSLVAGATVGGITTSQLGKQTDGTGSSSSSGNKTTVSKFTATASGSVSAGHSRLWVDTGTADTEMVVYADSSGAVGGLLGQSDTVTISNTAEAQINFTFSGAQQAAITAGQDYWIGFTWVDPGTNNITWSRDTTTSSAQQNNFHAPDPFGTATASSGPIDAFVDIVSGSGGGPVTPVIRSSTTGGKSANADPSITSAKPAGLVTGDYLLALYGGDADAVLSALTASGFTELTSQAANSGNNQPAGKVFGKVATSGDVAATDFTFGASTSGDAAVILAAIQTGTYSVTSPVTVLGSWTTQARTSSMQQTAPSITGVNGGLLIDVFVTDTNGTTESYPSSGPAGMTRVATRQGVPSGPYVMVGGYYEALTSTAATGTNSVSPTPSGITTNGWISTSLIVNPGSAVFGMTDSLDVPFTASNGRTSTYHRYAANLSSTQPLGLMIQLHGDGAFEYLNPDSTYSLGGTSGIIAQARYRNMICVPAYSPDRTGTVTWWESGAANSVYIRELIESLYAQYPNINPGRVWLVGYSGGSQQIAQYFMPAQSNVMSGGGAMIFGGGGVPVVTEIPYASGLLTNFKMKWYTGLLDNGTNTTDSPGLYDALSDSQAAAPYYASKGFTTVLENPAGVNHHIDTTAPGGFGPLLGRYLHTADAASVATTTSIVRNSSTSMTWTGTVTNAPAVTVRVSASAFGTQTGFYLIVPVDLTTRIATATITSLVASTPYNLRVEIGGTATHGTLLTTGTVPAT
jgi:hypothetical protein